MNLSNDRRGSAESKRVEDDRSDEQKDVRPTMRAERRAKRPKVRSRRFGGNEFLSKQAGQRRDRLREKGGISRS